MLEIQPENTCAQGASVLVGRGAENEHLQKYPAETDTLKRIKWGTVLAGVRDQGDLSEEGEGSRNQNIKRSNQVRIRRESTPGRRRAVPRSWGRNELGVL